MDFKLKMHQKQSGDHGLPGSSKAITAPL